MVLSLERHTSESLYRLGVGEILMEQKSRPIGPQTVLRNHHLFTYPFCGLGSRPIPVVPSNIYSQN